MCAEQGGGDAQSLRASIVGARDRFTRIDSQLVMLSV